MITCFKDNIKYDTVSLTCLGEERLDGGGEVNGSGADLDSDLVAPPEVVGDTSGKKIFIKFNR